MKAGGELVRSMFEAEVECRSYWRLSLVYTAVLAVAALCLILTGCGDISLNRLLENEEPGELRASPAVAAVPTGATVTIKGQGGFKPYTYEMESGSGIFDAGSGVYTTPGLAEYAEFRVTDTFGSTDTSQIEVIAPLKLYANGDPVSQLTITDSEWVEFDADGGKAAGEYRYYLDGTPVDPLEITPAGEWDFYPPGADTYQVEVLDDLDNSVLVIVSVIMESPGGELAISPAEARVQQGQTVSFTGINVQGTAVYTATAGDFSVTSPDAVYTAPNPYEGTVTVTLTDGAAGNAVTAAVHVLGVDPATIELLLSPSSADLIWGDELIFTVSGGIPPYAFWLGDGAHGALAKIGATTARYSAPNANTTDRVWVGDSVGTPSISAKVKVKAK